MRRFIQTHPLYRLGLVVGLGLLLLGLLLAWPLWLQPAGAAAGHRPAPAPAGAPAPVLLPLAVPPPPSCRYFPQKLTDTGPGVVNSQPDMNSFKDNPLDGTHIAYVSDEGGRRHIRLIVISSEITTTKVTSETDVSFDPAINGSGALVAFLSNGDLDPNHPTGNSDSSFEIFRYRKGVVTPTQFTDSPGDVLKTIRTPSINRVGSLIAFASDLDLDSTKNNSDGNQEIFLSFFLSVQQLTVSSLMQNGEPAISGDGQFIAFISTGDAAGDGRNSGDRRNQELFLLSNYNVIIPIIPTINQLTDSGGDVTNKQPSIGFDDGRIAFVSNGDLDPPHNNDRNFEIFLYDKNADPTRKIYQVTRTTGRVNDQPALSDDGGRLAFVSTGDLDSTEKNNGDGNQEIFVALLDDLNQITFTQVTSTSAPIVNQEPTMSSDGKFIAFSSNSDGNFEIYRAPCEFIDLRLRKTVASQTATSTMPFGYRFVVSVDGTSSVEDVILTDTLPPGLDVTGFTGCDDNAMFPGQSFVCKLNTLSPSQVVTVDLFVEADQPGVFTNSAIVTGTLREGLGEASLSNNEAKAVVYVDPTDLKITKSAAPAEISLGDSLTYFLRVVNNGPLTAERVVVTDTLPPGLTFVEANFADNPPLVDNFNDNTLDTNQWQEKSSNNSQADVEETNQRIEFTRGGHLITVNQFDPTKGRLRVSGVWTFSKQNDRLYLLTRSDGQIMPGVDETEMGIEFYVEDRNPSEDDIIIRRRRAGTTPTELAGGIKYAQYIAEGQTLQFEVFDDGQNVAFTLTNITQGSDPLTLTAIATATSDVNHIVFHNRTDLDRTSYLDDVNIDLTRLCRSQDDDGTTTISCPFNNLAPLVETDQVTLVVRADNLETTSIENRAEVQALQPDLQRGNNVDTTTTAIKIQGLDLEKSVSPAQLFTGDPLTYVLAVQNNEANPVGQVVVTDHLPDEVGLPTNVTSSHGSCTPASNPVVCNLGDLTGGETAMITITVLSTQKATLVNEAMVASASGSTATAVATAWVDPVNLSISKTPHAKAVELDQPLTYTIEISNIGSLPATGVVLTEALPVGLTFRTVQSSQGQCQTTDDVVRCTLNSIAEDGLVTLVLGVTAVAPGVITNVVAVSSLDPDPDLDNNQAQALVTVVGQAVYLPVVLKN